MPKIFISYARDQSYGQNLAAEAELQLQAAGFEVFRDVSGLKPGDVWYQKLEFELETSDAVVLIVSEKVCSSKWVHNEVSMAEEIGLPVIPVLAEKVRSPLWLRHLQALDFCTQTNWPALLCALPSVSVLNVSTTKVDMAVTALKSISTFEAKLAAIRKQLIWASTSSTDQYGIYADLELNGVVQRFRYIEAGTFWMGSPVAEDWRKSNEILHQVTLTKGFWLADTACTQALWSTFMKSNCAYFQGDPQKPVENLSWHDAQSFIQKLNEQIPGAVARLPSEAEWEYGCRAGTYLSFSFGREITPQQVNYNVYDPENKGRKGLYRKETVAVKSLPPNKWGLYEMHGNVWEWCNDIYCDYSDSDISDPQGGFSGPNRVLRGGSWYSYARLARSAYRSWADATRVDKHIGFRLAMTH